MASAVLQLGKNNASSRQDYWRRRMRMRWIEEHDEEDGEEPPDVCMLSPHPLLFLALALAFFVAIVNAITRLASICLLKCSPAAENCLPGRGCGRREQGGSDSSPPNGWRTL